MARFQFIMFFVCCAAILIAGWSIEVARMFAKRIRKERIKETLATPPDMPQVAVILPIKGVEEDTADNLRALLSQRYPRYRLLFAIESDADPVRPLLEQLTRDPATKIPIDIVTAGLATNRGQKIHNQLAAVARTTEADTYLVFLDADARPRPHWLRELVTPLAQPDVGATTGFRFYVPGHAGGNPTNPPRLASIQLSVINAAVAALLGPGWRNIAWGGSMAIARANFFAFGIPDAWQNALSDDYVLSYCVKNVAKKRIQFVHACLVRSLADLTWPRFWEFATRQYKITRICAPIVWLFALSAPLLYLAALFYTLPFYIRSLLIGHPDHPLLLMFAILYIENLVRGYLLLQGGLAALPEYSALLNQSRSWYTWLYPFSLLANFLAILRSAAGNTVTWRGKTYTMHNRLKTTLHPSTD